MALSLHEQIKQLIGDKKNILLTARKNATVDAIASLSALALFLEKQKKTVDIVIDGFILPKKVEYLPKAKKIKNALSHLQKFIITVDVKENGVEELSYDLKEEKLRIFITPKQGFLSHRHIRTAQTEFAYDLIFVLDSADLESLGPLYDNNTELFYKTPIVNLDHSPANEHFGQVNYIDLTVPSTAEVLFDLLQKIGSEFIDSEVATSLLSGMIAATRSFKSESVKPHTLATASKLMNLGANREHVVQNLYRTRSVKALKLWGQALTHMQSDEARKLVWSTITRDDFIRNDATETDLRDIIDELISTSPAAKVTVLIHEHPGSPSESSIHGMLHIEGNNFDARLLAEPWQATGTKHDAAFTVKSGSLKQVEEEIITHLKKQLH